MHYYTLNTTSFIRKQLFEMLKHSFLQVKFNTVFTNNYAIFRNYVQALYDHLSVLAVKLSMLDRHHVGPKRFLNMGSSMTMDLWTNRQHSPAEDHTYTQLTKLCQTSSNRLDLLISECLHPWPGTRPRELQRSHRTTYGVVMWPQ